MREVEQLIKHIDHHTNGGMREPWPGWYEDEFLQHMGVDILHRFKDEDWRALERIWIDKSDFWIKCLIDLVGQVYTGDERPVLINIARYGSDESTLDAMECVREFIDELNANLSSKLEIKLKSIVERRMKNP